MIEQLAFDFIESSPTLIILGTDPNDSSRILVECPDCRKVRSIAEYSKHKLLSKGNSRCRRCAMRLVGLARRHTIETSDICIVLNPFIECANNKVFALVKCPDCGKIAKRNRQEIRSQNHTICSKCVKHRRARTILTTATCIILKQFSNRNKHGNRSALVQCPRCGKIYERQRATIVALAHTICSSCSRAGSHSPLWKGGGKRYYGPGWKEVSSWVRERDNYRCQYPSCDVREQDLVRTIPVHHIIPLLESSDHSEKNLITLCPKHHLWADHHLDLSIPLFDGLIQMMYGPDY